MQKKVYLVDGSGYIFRAFYAVAPLTTKAGFPTNALFGFVRMLLKLLAAADSQHIAVVFDAGRETFRTELYKDYKANREECPPELRKQMPYFRSFSTALGLTILEQPGFEADDIIGTLTKRLNAEGVEVVIVSCDKDLMQLVCDSVSIWDTMNDRFFHAKEVFEKFGVGPDKVVEVLGLMGDSSDNVPGLDGVGPKTASQLISKYGSVEAVIGAVDQIENEPSIRNRKKIAERIRADVEMLRLSRKLVEIDCGVPLELKTNGGSSDASKLGADQLFRALERQPAHEKELTQLAAEFEFTSLLRDMKLGAGSAGVGSDASYQTVYADTFEDFCRRLSKLPAFAFDTETTSLNVQEAKLVGASFCFSDSEAFYIPLAHSVSAAGKRQVTLDEFRVGLAAIFESEKQRKIGQNMKYDINVLAEHGLLMRGVAFDTMIASYLLNPDKGSHNLTVLAQDYLKRPTIEYEEVTAGVQSFADVEVTVATRYACQDAHYAWLLEKTLSALLQERELDELFDRIEMPLVPVLAGMERIGVKLDTQVLDQLASEFSLALVGMEKELYALAGMEFNLNSPKQLGEVLFGKLGLPTKGVKKTKTGLSTDSGVLEKLAPLHPLPSLILRYRSLYKLKSTYVDVLRAQISTKTGRLHARFNQAVTGTGRLSSSDPNLQNIPIQTAEGRRIRAAFVAQDGSVLISADYSQIELRVLAHLSDDANLIEAFRSGVDIHAKTAREIMGLSENEEIAPELRRMGKTINFGVIYGMGPYRLSRELAIPLSEAQRYIEGYFDRYPGVKEFFAKLERDARDKGYVKTMYGRKRFIADIDSADRDQGFVVRAAMNAPIQGTAADLMKIAMLKLDRRIREEGRSERLLLQIHDELVFECPAAERTEAVALIRHEMEHVAEFKVPLKVDVGLGKNWEEAHS
ncbi:MAG: DNA polymerase I [Oligoflexia bacterium]|nr:DNA polymerase I [Oligoflexia bacterium]